MCLVASYPGSCAELCFGAAVRKSKESHSSESAFWMIWGDAR